MKLTKTYRVLKSKQSDWMKKYVDFNTEKRANAVNSFEKGFFKLMINSIYGKTMENLRKKIRPVNNETDFLKCKSRTTRITHKTFGKNYAAVHEIKPVLTINKPIYVGFTALKLSKWLMYDFHYFHFSSTKICLISVTIQKIQSFLTRLIKTLLVK